MMPAPCPGLFLGRDPAQPGENKIIILSYKPPTTPITTNVPLRFSLPVIPLNKASPN